MKGKIDINRRKFLRMTGLSAVAGAGWVNWPWAAAGELDPKQRAKRLAELMDEARLFERGSRRVYRGDNLTAISLPLGGIAAGPIQINGEARRHIWQIFRNYEAISLPNSFFAVRAQRGQSKPVSRVMQTVGESGLAPMKALSFSGEYPFGWYTFEDPALPVEVSMEVFSPLIPLNTKDSSIPCAIFYLTAENTGNEAVKVSFLATQQNPIGYRLPEPIKGTACKSYGGNINRVLRDKHGTGLHLHSNRPTSDPTYGDLALMTPTTDAVATARWDGGFDFTELAEAGPTPVGQTFNAAIAVPFVLEPGEKRTVAFVLGWHFSNTSFRTRKVYVGNRYATWWPDALTVARDVLRRLDSLTGQTRLFHATFYQSNLPHWLLDRMSSQVAILSSMTCHWSKDGFFYAFEGCNQASGCCPGNATHVWGYAQTHARLFPEIARQMRDEQLTRIGRDGMIALRYVPTHHFPAFDGMCHEISAALREHQTQPGSQWLESRWPAIKKAMDFIIHRWDKDGDGMLSGPQHAMDGNQGGTTSWLGGTYLCALAAATTMARLRNDSPAAERYGKILEAGKVNQDKALFNGEYYIQVPDRVPQQDYLTGCYIDQMLGQWWALQINLGWLYPPAHVRSAMGALFRHNFRADFHGFTQTPRRFCEDGDAGLLQGTWPRGGRPKPPHAIQYTEEVMSGFEYSAACLMLQCGLLREGFTVLRAASDRYDGRLRQLRSERKDFESWGYSGNPFGDDECGKFYARSMAIWSVLLAAQGFAYDAATAAIGFAPIWQPDNHRSFFSAADGWGLYQQKITDGKLQAQISVAWGHLPLQSITLPAPATSSNAAQVTLNGQALAATSRLDQKQWHISLPSSTVLKPGQLLKVEG